MDNLLKFLNRIHFLLLFIILEIIALSLALGSDVRKNSIILNSANKISGTMYEWVHGYVQYLSLKTENEILINQVLLLKQQQSTTFYIDTAKFSNFADTALKIKYKYISAQLIKNSTHKKNNIITLNKGTRHGIHPDMGVISSQGVVGIIIQVSANYATAISLLNTTLGISAKIKKNSYFGTIKWDGADYEKAFLYEIPNHVLISKGDTVVTSGFSAIFPPELIIGTVDNFEKNSDNNFYTITINLATNFKNLNSVVIIENLMKPEIDSLESKSAVLFE